MGGAGLPSFVDDPGGFGVSDRGLLVWDGRLVILQIVDQTGYETAVSGMVEAAELARANRAELLQRLAGVFARCEVWAQAGKYIDGLISDLPRKNGWTLAEQAGDATPDRMQRLLNHAVWDHEQVLALVRAFAAEQLAGPDQVVVIDESGQPKTGVCTVGGEAPVCGGGGEDRQRGQRRVRHAGQLAWSCTGGGPAVPAGRVGR